MLYFHCFYTSISTCHQEGPRKPGGTEANGTHMLLVYGDVNLLGKIKNT
jgi:hypothetical protein